GELNLTMSGAIQVGGAAPADPAVVRLPETLFAERGFRSVSLSTGGSITVPDGVTVTRVPLSVDLTDVDVVNLASGSSLTAMGRLAVLPPIERAKREPTSLSLRGRDVTIGTGATIRTDVGGAVSLTSSAGNVVVRGTIDAPAGAIKITGAGGSAILADGARL